MGNFWDYLAKNGDKPALCIRWDDNDKDKELEIQNVKLKRELLAVKKAMLIEEKRGKLIEARIVE